MFMFQKCDKAKKKKKNAENHDTSELSNSLKQQSIDFACRSLSDTDALGDSENKKK